MNESQLDLFYNFKPELRELCNLILCANAQIHGPYGTFGSVITLQGYVEGRYQTWLMLYQTGINLSLSTAQEK